MKHTYRNILLALFIAVIILGCVSAPLVLNAAARTFAQSSGAVPSTGAVILPVSAAAQATAAPAPAMQVAPGSLAAYQGTLEQIYSQVNPSVVFIDVVSNASSGFSQQTIPGSPFGFGSPSQQGQQEAQGSGFIWDNQGHIVTNNHVVAGATQIQVTFSDGTTASAKLVGADPNADLAVIQVNTTGKQLTPIQVGDSTQVKVGQLAIAIGNPYGLTGTMTVGVISGLQRSLPVESSSSTSASGATYAIPDIIQTDASINPGNSGGVLVDDLGKLIGVTAAIASQSQSNAGIGFVIPSAIVQKVVPSLISQRSYDHPWLGISGTTLTSDLATQAGLSADQQGALVIEVSPNGPAAKAGLKGSSQQASGNGSQIAAGGDVITAIDNQPVKRFEDLSSYLFNNTKAGQTVTLTILRSGKQEAVKVTIGSMPSQP